MKAIFWARALVQRHGWEEALRISDFAGRPLGKVQEQNPFAYFYQEASGWIKNNAPAGTFKQADA